MKQGLFISSQGVLLEFTDDHLGLGSPDHPGDLDIKRQRIGGGGSVAHGGIGHGGGVTHLGHGATAAYNGAVLNPDIYSSMWQTAPHHLPHPGGGPPPHTGSNALGPGAPKWGGAVKEEPKGPPPTDLSVPIPEILGAGGHSGGHNSGHRTPGGSPGHESPHTSFQYASAAATGFPDGSGGGAPPAFPPPGGPSGGGGGAGVGGGPVSSTSGGSTGSHAAADLIYDSINMNQVQNYPPSLSSSLGKQQHTPTHTLETLNSLENGSLLLIFDFSLLFWPQFLCCVSFHYLPLIIILFVPSR